MVLLDVRSAAFDSLYGTNRRLIDKEYGGEAVHSDNPRVNPPRSSGDWEVLIDPLGSQISYPEVKRGDSRLCQRREKT